MLFYVDAARKGWGRTAARRNDIMKRQGMSRPVSVSTFVMRESKRRLSVLAVGRSIGKLSVPISSRVTMAIEVAGLVAPSILYLSCFPAGTARFTVTSVLSPLSDSRRTPNAGVPTSKIRCSPRPI